MTTVGVLHPGAMGASVAAACRVDTIWCAAGRSAATSARAEAAGSRGVESLRELVELCDVIVSVCPPAAALATADEVASVGFEGVYVDANAISPATALEIGGRFGHFVDAGIIGPPAATPGTTRMYLAGAAAEEVAELWVGSELDARPIDGPPGAASSLKMAYALWTKGRSALLLTARSLARATGVEADLLAEWELSRPGTVAASVATAGAVAPKGWRFAGEMEELAATLAGAGLHAGHAHASSDVYRRLTGFRDADPGQVTFDGVIDAIVGGRPGE